MARADYDTDDEAERPVAGLTREWGPLPLEVTTAVRAHAPVGSFVVRPVLDAELLAAVEAEVVSDARPAPDETPESLQQRLARSTVFDNPRLVSARRTQHGFFRYQNMLPPREGGQARRATFAQLSQPAFVNDGGEVLGLMRGYSHLYRHREDQRMCRPMPASLCSLRDALYTQVCASSVFEHTPRLSTL